MTLRLCTRPTCLTLEQAGQLQTNARMLAEKLREADQRAAAAESSAASGKKEVQSLMQRLEAAEMVSDSQSKAHRKTVQNLESRISELTSQAARQTPERARPASAAATSSPEGKSYYLPNTGQYVANKCLWPRRQAHHFLKLSSSNACRTASLACMSLYRIVAIIKIQIVSSRETLTAPLFLIFRPTALVHLDSEASRGSILLETLPYNLKAFHG